MKIMKITLIVIGYYGGFEKVKAMEVKMLS